MVASHVLSTRDLAHNAGMCPDWELNQQPLGSQVGPQSTESHQPGLSKELLREWFFGCFLCSIFCRLYEKVSSGDCFFLVHLLSLFALCWYLLCTGVSDVLLFHLDVQLGPCVCDSLP